jgi:hypothetical protein
MSSVVSDIANDLRVKFAVLDAEEARLKARLLEIARERREVNMLHNACAEAMGNDGKVPPSAGRNLNTRTSTTRVREPHPSTIRAKLRVMMDAIGLVWTARELATDSGEKYSSVRAALSRYPEFARTPLVIISGQTTEWGWHKV